jgi:hypothetical protein
MWKLYELLWVRLHGPQKQHPDARGLATPPRSSIVGEGTARQATNLHLICVGAFGGLTPTISQWDFIGEHVTPGVAIINAFKAGGF